MLGPGADISTHVARHAKQECARMHDIQKDSTFISDMLPLQRYRFNSLLNHLDFSVAPGRPLLPGGRPHTPSPLLRSVFRTYIPGHSYKNVHPGDLPGTQSRVAASFGYFIGVGVDVLIPCFGERCGPQPCRICPTDLWQNKRHNLTRVKLLQRQKSSF